MKPFFFILICLLSCEYSIAQDSTNTIDSGGKIYSSKIFAGNIIRERVYYSENKLESEEFYKDSLPVGIHKSFYENGNIATITDYSKENSYSKLFYQSGKIRLYQEIKNKEYCGKYIEFYQDSTIKAIGKQRKSKSVGIWKFYYPNGQLQALGKYSKKFGFDNFDYSKVFDYSCLIQKETEFNPESSVYTQMKKGVWKFYDCKGNIVLIHRFKK